VTNKITTDSIRTHKLRIATIKATGEKRRLGWLGFAENKAVLFGHVTEVKYDKNGEAVLFHDEDTALMVPIDTISWEEVDFNEEVAKTL